MNDVVDIAALNRHQRDAYADALRTSHRIRVDLTVRDRDEKPVGSLSAPINRMLSGSVDVDATADITRSLHLTVIDPERKLRFEANSPAHGALYADRFLSARYEVLVEPIEAWVSVPVFWGPISKYERSGGEVTLEAQDKESLLLAPHYATHGYTIPKRTRLDDAIERVARRAGERRFALPRLDHRLARPRPVTARQEPWKVLAGGAENREGRRIAGLVEKAPGNRHVYYNPRGRLAVRRVAKRPSWTFAHGRDLISHPQVRHDTGEVINCVVVTGAKPKGKPPAHGRAVLPARHPLSPAKLAWNGVPRERTAFVDTELKTDRACRQRAAEVLDRLAAGGVEATFECLPVPHLEPWDRVRVVTPEMHFSFHLRKFTLPLTAADPAMSIGFNRAVKQWKRRRAYR